MSIVQQVATASTNALTAGRAAEFVRAAQAFAASSGAWSRAADYATAIGCTDRVADFCKKAAVSPGTMSDALSATGLVAAFVDSLRGFGAFDTLLGSMVRVPLKT